jgi:hypothetical protein
MTNKGPVPLRRWPERVELRTGGGRLAHRGPRAGAWALPALALLLALAACTHTVQVEAPKDPIVINLNVKIEQEVRVKVEKDVDDLLADNPELF